MMKNGLKSLLHMFLALAVGLVLLPAKPVYADDNYIEGFVLDAQTLPDGNIGVLYDIGGTSSSGVVNNGNLCYGVFDPQKGTWSAEYVVVWGEEISAREAAMVIYNDVVYVAYTTNDNMIDFCYQTDDGWGKYALNAIESNNAGGEGALSSPDLYVDDAGIIHIVYFDTRGVDDDRNSDIADVMEVIILDPTMEAKNTVIYGQEVSKDYVGWERSYALRPAKVTDSGDIVSVYREDKNLGNGDTSSKCGLCCSYQGPDGDDKRYREIYYDEIEYSLFDVCGNDALIYDGSQYYVIRLAGQSKTTVDNTSSGEGVMEKYAADITSDDGGNIYYAAAVSSAENNLLFYQDGEVSLKTAANAIHSSHNKLATVLTGDVQYAIYTNTDGNITITNLDAEGALVEYLPTKEHEDISGVTLTATGYAKGILSGLVAENGYRINGATPTVSAANQYGDFDAADTVEVVNHIVPDTPVTLVKYATSPLKLDSEEAEFTFTRAQTPSLEAVQPAANDEKGSIPTTTAHEFTTSDPTEDPDEVSWTACTGAMTDLAPGKYYVRVSAAESVLASAAQEITIKAFVQEKEETPEMTFAATGTETATIGNLSGNADDKYEITISGTGIEDKTITITGDTTKLTKIVVGQDFKAVLSVVKKGNGTTTLDSDAQTFEIHRCGKISLSGYSDPTTIGGKGQINNTSSEWQYRTSAPGDDPDQVEWLSCADVMINGHMRVPAGTYYIRVGAREEYPEWLASDPVLVTLEDPEEPEKIPIPTAECTALDYNSCRLDGLENGDYRVTGAGVNTEFHIGPNEESRVINYVMPGELNLCRVVIYSDTRSYSDPQVFTITRADTPALTAVNPTNRNTKGSIPTTSDYEYSTDDPDEVLQSYTPCNGPLTNLEAGTYYIRRKASGHALTSDYQKIVLTTQESWIVTFHANGHGETPEVQQVGGGHMALEPPVEVLPVGYTLGGWYTTAACADADRWDFNTAVESDQDLYAKWIPNPYTVKFDKNDPDAGGEMADQYRFFDDGKKLSKCTFTPPKGMVFSHWNTKPDGTAARSHADESTENIHWRKDEVETLYAQWVPIVYIDEIAPVTYTGANITLTPDQLHVYDGKKLLTVNQDYTVKYANQKNACDATEANAPTVTVTGKGNYDKQTLTAKFTIEKKSLSDDDITWTVKDVPFKEEKVQKQKPVIKYGKLTLKEGTDYTLGYAPENPMEGAVTITVTGKGNYKDKLTDVVYHIYKPTLYLNRAVIELAENADLTYGPGKQYRPEVKNVYFDKKTKTPLTLGMAGDYVIDYKTNEKAGTVTVIVTGVNTYCGQTSMVCKIKAKDLTNDENATINVTGDRTYTGKALKPAIEVKDGEAVIPATDYTVTYKNTTNVSDTPVVTVKFKGNYSGTISGTFAILPKLLDSNQLSALIPNVKLKKATDPVVMKPTVKYGKTTLKNGTDYKIEQVEDYGDLKEVKVVLQGNYGCEGEPVHVFFIAYTAVDEISEANGFTFELNGGATYSCTYNGNKQTPEVRIRTQKYTPGEWYYLQEGRDFTVTYSNNVNVGTATRKPTVTIKGKGAYKGTVIKTFEITQADLETMGENLQITVPDMKCTGKTLKPKVTVTLNGKALKPADYTVTFSDTTKVTEHAVATIEGKGNYKGSVPKEFRIYKNDISKVTFDRIADQFYTGSQIRPGERNVPVGDIKNDAVRIYENKAMTKPLHMGTDYTLEWGENVKTGNGTVIVKGIGDYGFSKTLTFKIKPKKVQ
ncbi:MAG: InlB B-repeat-containing protein [Lachnospiraceae bacterium]|nr:InlB B-repeat-containing protein [Lachnospiraceae bacterium]